jgi:hypothetical protein
MRNINFASRSFQAFYSLVMQAIPEKNTLFGTVSKFAFIIGMQIWPASTPKNMKGFAVSDCY